MTQVQNIALSKITTKNSYLRLDTDIETLAESIKMLGLIHPLCVNEEYELLAGGRRFSALKELGWEDVPVQVVSNSELEQELISIDENLVRQPLNKLELEHALNRGREIFEQLNPQAPRINVEPIDLTPEEKKAEKLVNEADESSFAAITALKTGLSKNVIRGAIKRDELSSEEVKRARSNGDLSASQVNEIIRLPHEEQEQIMEHIQDRSVKDIRQIINHVKKEGLEKGLEFTKQIDTPPREIVQTLKTVKKLNKELSKLTLENFDYNGETKTKLDKELLILKELLTSLDEDRYLPETSIGHSIQDSSIESHSLQ